jgi:hypothetical protein
MGARRVLGVLAITGRLAFVGDVVIFTTTCHGGEKEQVDNRRKRLNVK